VPAVATVTAVVFEDSEPKYPANPVVPDVTGKAVVPEPGKAPLLLPV